MAINPPSDILYDVAAAAQPAKLREATRRLETAGTEAAAAANFAAALSRVSGAKATSAAMLAAALPVNENKTPSAPIAQQDKTKQDALQKFEAFFLQTFVDSILPKDVDSVFGSGTAGDIWRSMLAEHMAAEMARSAKFGIAERMAGNHFSPTPQQSIAQPKPEPGANNLSYVKAQGKSDGLSTIAATPAGIMPTTRS